MQVKKLAEIFENEHQVPIELPEICAAMTDKLCCQDKIILSPQDTDPEICRGAYHQFTQRPKMYASPEWVSIIVYSSRMDISWQRIVCCKELMHVLDKPESRTRNKEDLEALSSQLLGLSDEFGLADIQVATDKIALYQALAVIFPPGAREDALAALSSKNRTITEIAGIVAIPEILLRLALTPDWPQIRQNILDC